jgi:CheY-like chemotaxis protein
MSHHILLVDDSAVARAAAMRLLQARGLDVTALASSREADGIDAGRFAAALLDLELGDGVGTEVARRLLGAAGSLPIAFLTAGGPARLLDEARRLGPVFSKTGGVEEAIAWIADAVEPAGTAADR